jgi:hypothetical protein
MTNFLDDSKVLRVRGNQRGTMLDRRGSDERIGQPHSM